MEPAGLVLTLGYLAITILQLTDKTVRFWNGVNNIDPKLDRLYSSLLSEQSNLRTWATQWKEAGSASMPSSKAVFSKKGEIHHLLERLHRYMQAANEKYSKIVNSSLRSDSRVMQLTAKIRFVVQGYNDLEEIISTMEKMNKALYNLAPPPPPYVEDLRAELRRPVGMGPLDVDQSDDAQQKVRPTVNVRGDVYMQEDVFNLTTSHDIATLNIRGNLYVTRNALHKDVGTRQAAHADATIVDRDFLNALLPGSAHGSGLKSKESFPQDLHDLALDSLNTIRGHVNTEKKQVDDVASRLKLWGVGLFEGSASLNILLSKDRKDQASLRETYVRNMVVLLSHLDLVLKCIPQNGNLRHDSILDILTKLDAAFKDEESQVHVINMWEVLLDDDDEGAYKDVATGEAYLGHAEPPKTQNKLVESQPSARENELTARRVTQDFPFLLHNQSEHTTPDLHTLRKCRLYHLKKAAGVTRNLFQMLPIVSVMRYNYRINMSQKSAIQYPNTPTPANNSVISETCEEPSRNKNTDLDVIEQYIQDRDRLVLQQGYKVPLFEPRLKQEMERFAERKKTLETKHQAEMDTRIQTLLSCLAADIDSRVVKPISDGKQTTAKRDLKISTTPQPIKDEKVQVSETDQILNEFMRSVQLVSTER